MNVNRVRPVIDVIDDYFDHFIIVEYHGVGIHAIREVVCGRFTRC